MGAALQVRHSLQSFRQKFPQSIWKEFFNSRNCKGAPNYSPFWTRHIGLQCDVKGTEFASLNDQFVEDPKSIENAVKCSTYALECRNNLEKSKKFGDAWTFLVNAAGKICFEAQLKSSRNIPRLSPRSYQRFGNRCSFQHKYNRNILHVQISFKRDDETPKRYSSPEICSKRS